MKENKLFKRLMMFAIAAFMMLGAFTLTTSAASCDYEVWLYDSYGDGWNGNIMDVYVDGAPVLTGITVVTGSGPVIYSFTVDDGSAILMDWQNTGSWPGENYFDVYDSTATLIEDDWLPFYAGDWTGTASCPSGGGTCDYEICVDDTYGDTWNGGYLDIYVAGVPVILGLQADDYSPYTWQCYTFTVNDGDNIDLDYTYGGWSTENEWELYDSNGILVHSMVGGPSDTAYDSAHTASCAVGPVIDVGVTAINSPVAYQDVGVIPISVDVTNFGTTTEDIPVNVIIQSGGGGVTGLTEDFEGTFLPVGWTIVNYGTGPEWIQGSYGDHSYEPPGSGTYYANCWYSQGTGFDTGIFTPSLSLGATTLTFERNFQDFAGYGYFEVNTYSGGTGSGNFEENLLFITVDDPSGGVHTVLTFDASTYSNPGDVYIEFYYNDDNYNGWGAGIDDVEVAATTASFAVEYDETVTVTGVGPGVTVTVSTFPDWTPAEAGYYTVEGCTELVADTDAGNDCLTISGMPIGDLDVGVTDIVVPHALMAPMMPFVPNAIVENFGDIDAENVPVHAVIEGGEELKFEEDFEILAGFNTPDIRVKSEIDITPNKDEVAINLEWETDPGLKDVSDWTILDLNYDGITWHQTDYKACEGTYSMYCGDDSDHLYEPNSFDWMISPAITVGSGGRIEVDIEYDVETYYDGLYIGNSHNGNNFMGTFYDGYSGGCITINQNLAESYIAPDGTTYIAFVLMSDFMVQYEGAYVDNVKVYGGGIVYDETVYVDLDAGEVESVDFPPCDLLDIGTFEIEICTELSGDEDPLNDCDDLSFSNDAPVYNTRTGFGYATIQDAIDDPATLPGDTLIARDGFSFTEDVTVWKEELTVMGEFPPTSTTIIYGTVDIVADGVTFQNFKVIPGGLYTTDEAGIFIAANDVTVQDNIIEGMTGEVTDTMFTVKGIHVFGYPDQLDNILIQNNIIRNIVNTNQTGGGGGSWTFLKNYNLPGTSPETWYMDTIDLSAYDGQTIQLAWQYVSDDEWAAYYDDISVQDGGSTYFSENFDSYPNDYTFDGTAACGFWNQENYGSVCGSTYHYIMVENYKSHSAPYSAEAYYNCPNDDWLTSPDIDLTGSSGAYLEFWYLWDDSWDIEFNVYVMASGGGPTTYYTGGADGIMLQGNLTNVNVLDNSITDIHSTGWCYGVEVTPTAGTFGGSFAGDCTWEIWLYDTYGDGWDETPDYGGPNLLDVIVDGIVVLDDIYLATGSGPEVYTFDVDDGSTIELQFTCHGSYCNENEYALYDSDGLFVNLINGDSQPYYVTTAYCPGGPGPSGKDILIHGNYFTQIGDGSMNDVWDNPMIAPYPGVMFSLDESYPGADDGDATAVELRFNIFDNDCSIPILAVVNKDTDGILDAEMNYWGNILGPGSYGAPVYDAVTGDLADAEDFSCSIVAWGPVHFTPFVGIDAVATASSLSVETGEVVIFNAAGSFAADFDDAYTPVYYWSFGDGFHSNEEQIGHSYGSPGTYDVSVRVQGQGLGPLYPNFMFDWAHLSITVTSPSAPLDANADGGNLGGYETVVGEDVQLYGSASGGEPKYTYSWDLDNGQTSNQRNPTTVYEFEGVYTVTLTVTDSEGNIATDMAQVNVLARDELIASAGGPYNGVPSTPVFFVSEVIGGTGPFTYTWDLGDGTLSGLVSPVHAYDEVGTYTVTLTVEDSLGEIDTDTTIVTVEAADEDEAIIGEIQGGLGVKATIKAGSEPVDWTINVDGKFVFMGGAASGSISAGATETVRLPFSLGIGSVDITITANSITKECTAFMIGPFVLIK